MSRILRAGIVAAALASLGGCALLDVADGPAPRFFTLTPPALQTKTAEMPVQLAVKEFSASAALDTSRIIYQPSQNEIKYYAGARWADQTPAMIRELMVETLEKGGAFAAVVRDGGAVRADYTLSGEIRRFAAMPAGGDEKQVQVVFLVRLMANGTNRIVGTKEFSETVSSVDGGMDNVVGAYNAALGNVLSKLSAWTADTLRNTKPVS